MRAALTYVIGKRRREKNGEKPPWQEAHWGLIMLGIDAATVLESKPA